MTQSQQAVSRALPGRGWFAAALLCAGGGMLLLAVRPFFGFLLFCVGGYCGYRFWRLRNAQAEPGPLELRADPSPGALEGDVGGWIDFQDPGLGDSAPVIQLSCIRLSERQRSQIVEHRRETLWSECRPVYLDREQQTMGFCFSPPDHLPETQPQPAIGEESWAHHHYWLLTLKGQHEGLDYSKNFRIPVRRYSATMATPPPETFLEENRPLADESGDAVTRLEQEVGLRRDGEVLRFECPPATGQWLEPLLAAFGLLILLLALTGAVSGFWRVLWLAAGLVLALSAGFRWGRGLATELKGADFAVTTFWFGRPLFVRRAMLAGEAELKVEPRFVSMLRFDGTGEPGYDLLVHHNDRKVLVARDISGKGAAEALAARLREHAAPGAPNSQNSE